MKTRIFLHNIRSAHNVGSIFRTADGAGVERVYLGGYTPAPVDRFGRSNDEIAKTSLGASESVSWEHVEGEVTSFLSLLKEDGWHVAAVEQDLRAVPFHAFVRPGKVLYVFGNEVEGVPRGILDIADTIIEIPMHGTKESLNVSVAAGIVLFNVPRA